MQVRCRVCKIYLDRDQAHPVPVGLPVFVGHNYRQYSCDNCNKYIEYFFPRWQQADLIIEEIGNQVIPNLQREAVRDPINWEWIDSQAAAWIMLRNRAQGAGVGCLSYAVDLQKAFQIHQPETYAEFVSILNTFIRSIMKGVVDHAIQTNLS